MRTRVALLAVSLVLVPACGLTVLPSATQSPGMHCSGVAEPDCEAAYDAVVDVFARSGWEVQSARIQPTDYLGDCLGIADDAEAVLDATVQLVDDPVVHIVSLNRDRDGALTWCATRTAAPQE